MREVGRGARAGLACRTGWQMVTEAAGDELVGGLNLMAPGECTGAADLCVWKGG